MDNWRGNHSSQRGRGDGHHNRFFNNRNGFNRGSYSYRFPQEYAPQDNFQNRPPSPFSGFPRAMDLNDQVPYYEHQYAPPMSPPMDAPRNRYRNAFFPDGPQSPPYAPPIRYRNGYRLNDNHPDDLIPPASPPHMPPNRRYNGRGEMNNNGGFRGDFSNFGRGGRQFHHFNGNGGRTNNWRPHSFDGGRHNHNEHQNPHRNQAGNSYNPRIGHHRQHESGRRRSSVPPEHRLPNRLRSATPDVALSSELHSPPFAILETPIFSGHNPMMVDENVVNVMEELPQVDVGFPAIHEEYDPSISSENSCSHTINNYEFADLFETYPDLNEKTIPNADNNQEQLSNDFEDGPFGTINQLVDLPSPSAFEVLLVQNEHGGLDIAEGIAIDHNDVDFQQPQQTNVFNNDQCAAGNSDFSPVQPDNDMEAHCQRPLYECFSNGRQFPTGSTLPVEQYLVEVPVHERRKAMEAAIQDERNFLSIKNELVNFILPGNEQVGIREVWASNLEPEFGEMRRIIDVTCYISIDAEFPGVVAKPIGDFRSATEYCYQMLRGNVDFLKVIQLGLSFFDANGNIPDGFTHSTWQFNFKFNVNVDIYSEDSINMLRKAGVQFDRLANEGIDPMRFAELFMNSGIALMDKGRYTFVGFHSANDFGYLLKLLTNRSLPRLQSEFYDIFNLYFPLTYDIKYLIKDMHEINGGLDSVAAMLKVDRKGTAHQAGSDALLTGQVFFQLRKRFFNYSIDPDNYAGHLFGLME